MRIIRLEAQNVKRLKAVAIEPKGNVVAIRGRNAQGKTSVLDSIQLALGGKKYDPPKVIHDGATEASIVLETEDLVVTRRWTSENHSYLDVRDRDGLQVKQPQTTLDRIVGAGGFAFDPLAFLRLEPAKQLELLRKLTGVDLTDLEKKRVATYDTRTTINRDLERAKARLGSTPAPSANVPDEEVSVKVLMDQQAALMRQRDANAKTRAQAQQADRELAQAQAEAKRAEATVADLERRLADAKKALEASRGEVEMARAGADATAEDAKALVEPDFRAIEAQLATIEETNRAVRSKREHGAVKAQVAQLQGQSDSLTTEIAKIDTEKERRVAEAKMPVPGLGFGAAGLTLSGIPFEQASQAEQLKVSVAMGLALNPQLRILLIRDASLLDEDSLATVAQMATAADAQVWIEVVGKNGAGFVIEDGEVASSS